MTYHKIKTKREERKEKKRRAYADRYQELEREHLESANSQVQGYNPGGSRGWDGLPKSSVELTGRRSSSGSLRAEEEEPDARQRSGGGTRNSQNRP